MGKRVWHTPEEMLSQARFPPGKFRDKASLLVLAARIAGIIIFLALLLTLAGRPAIRAEANADRTSYHHCAITTGQTPTNNMTDECYPDDSTKLLEIGTDGQDAPIAARVITSGGFTTQAPNLPLLVQPTDGASGVSTSPTLEVAVSDPEENDLSVTFYGRQASADAAGEDFTLVAFPDTQNETTDYPEAFSAQTQWIADNKVTQNIAFATHLGDIVNIAASTTEWDTADAAMDLLDPANVFYSVGPGNHDIDTGSLYETYFGVSRFSGKSWYGGHYGSDNYNNYSLFSASGMDFILINLEYQPTTEILDWADARLKEYSGRRGIVVSHNILNLDNSWSNGTIYNALRDNPNLFLMLCGHMHLEDDGAAYRAALGDDGHTIHVMLADYQDFPYGGNGYLRILHFSPEDDTIYATTYSPFDGTSITSYPDQMEMAYEMEDSAGFELLGTVSGIASGSHASLTWPGLDSNIEHEWYVEVSNGEETTSSPTWSFTTQGTVLAHDLEIAVEPAGSGTTNPAAGVHTYASGSMVSITATQAAGYTFDHWSGACTGSGTCQVTMDANKTVTAHFDPISYNLTVAVDPVGGGTTNPSVGVHSYTYGSVVSITATSVAGYTFDHWSGVCTGSGACQVTMDGDKTVTAHFTRITYNLTIAVDPTGSGTTNPAVGIHTYTSGTNVSITATPAAGYRFDHWSGACTGSAACQVTMDANKAVTAYFTRITYSLTIAVDSAGSGTTNPSAGIHTYTSYTNVSITATPAAGYTFDHWSGACGGSGICQVTMDANKAVTAHFTLITYSLTIAVDSIGWGTTNPSAGVYTYPSGTNVSITATPTAGYRFDHWSGACEGSGTCQVTMDANKAVTAHFTLITYNLTIGVDPAGSGTTNPTTGIHTYVEATVVPITAMPAARYRFDYWTGDVAEPNSASTTVLMDANKTITAHFSEITYELTIAVDPIGGGITNPVVGVHTYTEDSVLAVTATPSGGYLFNHWSGACSGSSACQVTMDGDKTVTAHFAGITYDLRIAVDPLGSGYTTPSTGIYTYAENVVVPVTAAPAAGYTFTHWSGDVSEPSSASTILFMDGDKTITAYFTLNSYTLSVSKVGSGSGAVTSAPSGIDCGTICSYDYDHGSAITLYTQAAPGSTFSGWSEAGCSGTASCTVTLIAARNVTATFDLIAPQCYTLTLSHTGQGSDPVANPANSAGCPSGQFVEGEMIHLSGAIPDDGWGISAWTGTSLDASLVGTNSLSMPARDHAASVIYKTASYLPAIYGIIPTGE